MKCLDLIVEIAENILNLQNDNGSFPAGHNGPHNDPDTPVRNTSHILILLSNCYQLTGNSKFIDRALKAANFLYSKEARPLGFAFHHRNMKGKDRCNGLIGQAWTFEALIKASEIFEDEKYLLLAEEVLMQHPFDFNAGLWQTLEIDGKPLGINNTFNQQLWFAACSSSVIAMKENDILNKRTNRFMDRLPENLKILKNGLIFHLIKKPYKNRKKLIKNIGKKSIRKILSRVTGGSNEKAADEKHDPLDKIYRAVGYFSFNMCAFAILKKQIPDISFWESDLIKKAFDYMLKSEYKDDLDDNIYGYPYNSPGFEIPFVLDIFNIFGKEKIIEISGLWINEQFRRCYNKDTRMMDKNTTDPLTLTARTYELYRLNVNVLNKINIIID